MAGIESTAEEHHRHATIQYPGQATLRLEDEVRRLLPLLVSAARPVDVVAHSYRKIP